jgi:hypothetical protein
MPETETRIEVPPGTSLVIRYLPGAPDDPIPWAYYVRGDDGAVWPESIGWAGTASEAFDYCAEKVAANDDH